jgi:DNA-directed RNA polymerase subunit RPC12/RpoP
MRCGTEVRGEGAGEERTGGEALPCPVCGGSLLPPARGEVRCGRCGFRLCAGCDSSFWPEPAGQD